MGSNRNAHHSTGMTGAFVFAFWRRLRLGTILKYAMGNH
jgi:hypothetical protein